MFTRTESARAKRTTFAHTQAHSRAFATHFGGRDCISGIILSLCEHFSMCVESAAKRQCQFCTDNMKQLWRNKDSNGQNIPSIRKGARGGDETKGYGETAHFDCWICTALFLFICDYQPRVCHIHTLMPVAYSPRFCCGVLCLKRIKIISICQGYSPRQGPIFLLSNLSLNNFFSSRNVVYFSVVLSCPKSRKPKLWIRLWLIQYVHRMSEWAKAHSIVCVLNTKERCRRHWQAGLYGLLTSKWAPRLWASQKLLKC